MWFRKELLSTTLTSLEPEILYSPKCEATKTSPLNLTIDLTFETLLSGILQFLKLPSLKQDTPPSCPTHNSLSIIVRNEIELSKYFRKNLISNEIIIGMGAGVISKWIRELKSAI